MRQRDKCAARKNIHTSPTEDQWKFQGGGEWQQLKFLNGSMELNLISGGGGGGQTKKKTLCGGYGYFLETHYITNVIVFTLPH